MSFFRRIFPTLTILAITAAAQAAETGGPLAPFEAKDLDGHVVKLADLANEKAVALVSHQVSCGVLRRQGPEIERIAKEYAPKGVRFFYLNSSLQDTPASIRKDRKYYGLKIPLLIDKDQVILRDAGFTVSAEILVIDPRTGARLYQGPVNDRVTVEGVKAKAAPYLRDALDDILAGRPVKEPKRRAFGCTITYLKKEAKP